MNSSKQKTFVVSSQVVSQSCGSFSDSEIKKERAQRPCCSQPFLKPNVSLLKLIEVYKSLRSLAKSHSSLQVTYASSLDVSKLVPGHASQLHGVVKLAKLSLLSRERDEEDGGKEKKGLKQEAETETVPSQGCRTTVCNPEPFAVSQSCGSFRDYEIKKEITQRTCCSQPLFRPSFSLPKLAKPSVFSRERDEEDGGMESFEEWQSMTKSAVKITLDPKTAHPTLRISTDGRRVRSITFEESKGKQHAWFQLAPHMYNAWFCILGTQGFISGRHYWEVVVGESSDWRIGVVKESATRYGFTKLTTSSGYWTLRLQLGRLIALTDPVTKLNQPIPNRVGVYLDMEGRQVRFFDAKQRRHIYTFQAEFGNYEKIYPVIGTVDTNRELVIL